MNKRDVDMIFGLGTARCGTYNLSRLLDLPHERFWLPWKVNETLLSHHMTAFKEHGGNVGLYILNYTGLLHDAFPDAKFVCLQRDMALTVRSFVNRLVGRNVWCDEKARAGHQYAFPEYNGLTIEEAAGRYWRDYYAIAYEWQRKLPFHFRIFNTAYGLGEGMDDLLAFCGLERVETT
jgi:hypothetical protein